MSKYSSLLFAPKEYHVIPPFRFPIYKDLVPGEARAIEVISRKQSKHTYRSIQLAKRIAKDRDISVKEAIEALSGATDESAADILMEYSSDMEELQSDAIGAYEQQIEYVTVFMQYRGEARLDPQISTWTKLADWSLEDTELMPSALLRDIFKLILWERDGWPEEAPPEDAEGNAPAAKKTKPPTSPESSSDALITSTRKSPTGTRSTSASALPPLEETSLLTASSAHP